MVIVTDGALGIGRETCVFLAKEDWLLMAVIHVTKLSGK